MFLEEVVNASPIAIWSIVTSVVGGVLVFVITRLAIFLYRSGDVSIYCKRIADLNPRCVKLSLRVENGQAEGRRLNDLSLYANEGKDLVRLAGLEETPVLRKGQHTFIQGRGEQACLQCGPHSDNEAILEFKLPTARDDVFLVYTNMKGRKRKAKVKLGDSSERLLTFHHF